MTFRALVGLVLCLQGAASSIGVLVADGAHRPVPGVRIELKVAGELVAATQTDEDGRAQFGELKPARYDLNASKDGFEPIQKTNLELPASVELTLMPLARKESIEVKGSVAPLEAGASVAGEVPAQAAKDLPGRPPTVADALPLLPGVVRVPGGGLVMSAAGEHRSALMVNSADVTDPATGQFGLTVPIDSVETMNVYQTAFLAEYGRFTAGLVSVATRRGGEHWKWDLSDPFPDFIIRSYHLRGLRDATPRLNVEGPIIAGKLYFSEGLEYTVRKTQVYELPFPFNQKKQEGFNSFAQLDWVASSKQLVTATVHVAPQRMANVNLNYFNPQATSPDAATDNITATLADKLTLGNGLLENTLSVTHFDARVWGQGTQELTIAPGGNSGNYFAGQRRDASRLSWTPVNSFAAVHWLGGTHNFKTGAYLAESTDNGVVTERPFNIVDASNQLLERVTFTPGMPFRNWDLEYAFFAQDHWMVTPRLAVDLGIRMESQELSESLRVAPRAGIAWTPFANTGTVLRAGFGWFYDRVPLSVYSFSSYPNESVTMFGPGGQISAGPTIYQNGLGTVSSKSVFVFKEPGAGNFSPRSDTGNLQIEQPLSQHLLLRIGYTQKQSAGLVILNPVAPSQTSGGVGTNLLTGGGQSRYHQFEVTARLRANEKRQLFFSYVRARARGDLNDFANYLGSFPVPIVRANQFGNLAADLPNRFLAWGVVQLPAGFRIAPLIEYRSGFPYAVTDAAQNYVGVPNAQRFPSFFSVDSRFSKDIKVNPKYTVRLSVSSYNLTNHFNPEAFHNNVADPAFGLFFGQRGRRFTADFDVIF
jgi:Carboxypeptidase regulatory-like domain